MHRRRAGHRPEGPGVAQDLAVGRLALPDAPLDPALPRDELEAVRRAVAREARLARLEEAVERLVLGLAEGALPAIASAVGPPDPEERLVEGDAVGREGLRDVVCHRAGWSAHFS